MVLKIAPVQLVALGSSLYKLLAVLEFNFSAVAGPLARPLAESFLHALPRRRKLGGDV
jgi:hypothetical protein